MSRSAGALWSMSRPHTWKWHAGLLSPTCRFNNGMQYISTTAKKIALHEGVHHRFQPLHASWCGVINLHWVNILTLDMEDNNKANNDGLQSLL
jgi:hypothetical protein